MKLKNCLTPTLAEDQKAGLQETFESIGKLIEKKKVLDSNDGSRALIKTKALNRIRQLETQANEGSEKASGELLAARDQLARFERTTILADREHAAL